MLYALGFLVMLSPLLSGGLNGWVGGAVVFAGVALFSIGLVLEGDGSGPMTRLPSTTADAALINRAIVAAV